MVPILAASQSPAMGSWLRYGPADDARLVSGKPTIKMLNAVKAPLLQLMTRILATCTEKGTDANTLIRLVTLRQAFPGVDPEIQASTHHF